MSEEAVEYFAPDWVDEVSLEVRCCLYLESLEEEE